VEGSYRKREQIFQDHVNYQQGSVYFLANDPGLPESLRAWQRDVVGVEGQFDHAVPRPYRISDRCLRPKRIDCVNLLVPTVISATRPAFGSARMEPVFMILGQSAGAAAALAIDSGVAVHDVDYPGLRAILLEAGQLLD
jgi:hypothetical protein